MNITKVILASDDNPNYIDFWPLVANAWKKIGIEPVLFYTGSKVNSIDKTCGQIVDCKPMAIPTAFYAQNIRLLAPALFPNDVCIISDIDLLPLSHKFFHGNAKKYDDNQFVAYTANDTVGHDEHPIMFNVATGKVWGDIFHVSSWDDIYGKLQHWVPNNYGTLGTNKIKDTLYHLFGWGDGWFTDQRQLRKHVDSWKHQDRVVRLDYDKTGCFFLGRKEMPDLDIVTTIFDPNIKDKYTCYHMPRPFSKHKSKIIEVYDCYHRAL